MKISRRATFALLGLPVMQCQSQAEDELATDSNTVFDPSKIGWLHEVWHSWSPKSAISRRGIKITVIIRNRIAASAALLEQEDGGVLILTPSFLSRLERPDYQMLIETRTTPREYADEALALIKAAYALPPKAVGEGAGLDGKQFYLVAFRMPGMERHLEIEFTSSTKGLPQAFKNFESGASRMLGLD